MFIIRCCQDNIIKIVIAKNQITIARSLAENNAIRLLQDVKELSRVISGATCWMTGVSNIARQVSDGLGLKRVVSVIIDRKL